MVLKLVIERVLRKRMAGYFRVRQRPGTSEPGAILRGADVPTSGPSFPSGHVILVAAVATVLATDMPLSWSWLPPLLVVLVMVGRVYVGAHNPLDVTAGLGAGLLAGGLVACSSTDGRDATASAVSHARSRRRPIANNVMLRKATTVPETMSGSRPVPFHARPAQMPATSDPAPTIP